MRAGPWEKKLGRDNLVLLKLESYLPLTEAAEPHILTICQIHYALVMQNYNLGKPNHSTRETGKRNEN